MNTERDILHRLSVIVYHLKKGFQDFITPYGLTEMEAKIIFFMDNGQCKTSELITRFEKHKSTIRQKTRSLEEKKYIIVKHAENDKRERIISLTKKGEDFYTNFKKIEREYSQKVLYKFNLQEKQTLIALLEKIEIEHHENTC